MRSRRDPPFSGAGLIVRAGAETVGLAKAHLLPSLRDGEALVWLDAALAPDHSRAALAARLIAGALEQLPPAAGGRRLVASTPRDQEAVATALTDLGFREIAGVRRYEAKVGLPVPKPDRRFALRHYRGGDPALDEAIAALYRRAFRAQPTMPALTPELVRRHLGDPRYSFALLHEGDDLVAEASLWREEDELYVGTILVARSHWASGASDSLMNELLCHAARSGCRRFSGQIATSNRANLALMERSVPGARCVVEMRRFERLDGAA